MQNFFQEQNLGHLRELALREVAESIERSSAVRPATDQGANAYLVDTVLGSDLRAELAEFVVGRGWGLLELRSQEMSLEDVFRQLTTEEKGAA